MAKRTYAKLREKNRKKDIKLKLKLHQLCQPTGASLPSLSFALALSLSLPRRCAHKVVYDTFGMSTFWLLFGPRPLGRFLQPFSSWPTK